MADEEGSINTKVFDTVEEANAWYRRWVETMENLTDEDNIGDLDDILSVFGIQEQREIKLARFKKFTK